MAVARVLSDTLPMVFVPADRLRSGDASAWPRYRPQNILASEVWQAWSSAMKRLGTPGVPRTTRVYTHFVYCESTCNFCMYFHQVPREAQLHTRYVDYLVRSIERFCEASGRVRASAAYVGGGTPSATPTPELARYLRAFRAAFDIEGEFSFEAHPRSMDLAKLELVHAHGVNRISMGVQSLEPEVLRQITRKNAPLRAIAELVSRARSLGMLVNLDLVLGLPGQSIDSFRADMARITELGPDVVTLYRYQTVPTLAHQAPAEMHHRQALGDEGMAIVEQRGYRVGDPVEDHSSTVRLVRRDAVPGGKLSPAYALFDEEPSHLIGFGPGAYGHVFGYGWFREVTSLAHLAEPTYWGTRLSALDECRQMLLDALHNGREWNAAELRNATGVDVEIALAEPLRWAKQAGALVPCGAGFRFGPLTAELRERLIDGLMPEAPGATHEAPAPQTFQPELVSLKLGPKSSSSGDAELVRAWCEAIGVPERGRRLFGAIVRARDDRSVTFAVQGKDPLRVLVQRPGAGRAFFETLRFAISYASRPGQPPSAEELAFLSQLRVATERALGS